MEVRILVRLFGISKNGTKPNGSNCSEWNATVGAAATLYSETISDLEGGQSYYLGGSADKCILAYVKVTLTPSCEDPEFTVSPTEGTGFVGDPIDITVGSKTKANRLMLLSLLMVYRVCMVQIIPSAQVQV